MLARKYIIMKFFSIQFIIQTSILNRKLLQQFKQFIEQPHFPITFHKKNFEKRKRLVYGDVKKKLRTFTKNYSESARSIFLLVLSTDGYFWPYSPVSFFLSYNSPEENWPRAVFCNTTILRFPALS